MIAPHVLSCPGPPLPAGMRLALVWAADPGAVPAVTDAARCLPQGWLCLGTATVTSGVVDPDREWDLLELTWMELNTAVVRGVRARGLALALDVIDGAEHWRIWLPAVRPVDGWQKFAVDPDGRHLPAQPLPVASFAGRRP